MGWVRRNWHVPLGVALAFGLIGVCVAYYVCLPVGCLTGAASLLQFAEMTPESHLLPSPTFTSIPTPTPTATTRPTALGLGESATMQEGLRIAIIEYQTTHTCPDGRTQAPEGAKLIVIQVRLENAGGDVAAEIPNMVFMLLRNGAIVTRDWEASCLYADDSLGNACWEWGGRLYPGVSCQGWVAFEVAEAINPEELLVDGPGGARWRLGP
jgi:hypothetical protein